MTTYLGEKAVGVGTIKTYVAVADVLHDNTLVGNGNTEPLGVNTENIVSQHTLANTVSVLNTAIDGQADAIAKTRNDFEVADQEIRAEITNVEDRVRELTKSTDGEFVDIKLDVSDLKDADTQIRAEITNVEDEVRELRKGTHDELVDVKLDVSDLKDADQNIRTEMAGLQTQVTAQIAGKQDKLTAGENITIEDGVISATGGGGADALQNEATGTESLAILGTATGVQSVSIGKNSKSVRDSVAVGCNANANSGGVAIGVGASTRSSTAANPQIAIGYNAQVASGFGAIQIGTGTNSDANTFKVANRNGNFEMMSADGTIPLERLTKVTDQIGDISTALTAILGE
jgi:hypothetical protein